MMRPLCFSCHEELHYISNRRMMCYNRTCEKIYGMDYKCAACSAKKQLKVLMEVTASGEVCCSLCGDERKAPGLNLETMMRSKTVARFGGRGQTALRLIPPHTSTGIKRTIPRIGDHIVKRQADSTEESIFSPIKSRIARKKEMLSAFPERAEPYIEETSDGLIIIVEFPRHTIDQIQWRQKGSALIIESAILTCPYRDEITLLNWAKEPNEVKLLNGFLTIKFIK